MTDWDELLRHPNPENHFVQLYTDDGALARNVGRYIAAGIWQGGCGLLIATAAHRELFRAEIGAGGVDVQDAESAKKLLFLDAALTLEKFMVAGSPDWNRFRNVITRAAGTLDAGCTSMVRAYGEMVGLLWTSGEYSAAIRLEEYWNGLLGTLQASLFCSYPIDRFGDEFESNGIHAILCDHTHLLPEDDGVRLTSSVQTAMQEALGPHAASLWSEMNAGLHPGWGTIPPGESLILWLRTRLPDVAGGIIRRSKELYEAGPSTARTN